LEISQETEIHGRIIDDVAWPDTAKPEFEGGVKWVLISSEILLSTGFFSTEAA